MLLPSSGQPVVDGASLEEQSTICENISRDWVIPEKRECIKDFPSSKNETDLFGCGKSQNMFIAV